MDYSTVVIVSTLAFVLLILRWLISPIPQSVPEEFNIPDPAHQPAPSGSDSRQRRPVTESMIEVVQAIGPHLSVSQIKYSLENTGSVEATVEYLMENGNLPFPPGEPTSPTVSETVHREKEPKSQSKSLLEKYDVFVDDNGMSTSGKWGKDENERGTLLHKRKAEMIMKARRNMKEAITESK